MSERLSAPVSYSSAEEIEGDIERKKIVSGDIGESVVLTARETEGN